MSSEFVVPDNHSAEVVDFRAYRNRELIEVLEAALSDARRGKIDGAILVLQHAHRHHAVAVVGAYENDPRRVAGIAGEIFVHFMPKTPGRPTVITD